MNKATHIATALLFAATQVNAASPGTAPILFDPLGGGGGLTVGAFDWSINNFLAKSAIPTAEGDSFQIYEQAELVALGGANGELVFAPGLGRDYEITLVLGMKVSVSQLLNLTTIVNIKTVEDQSGTGENFFRIYRDATPDADVLTGSGFGDGELILEGVIVDESSNNDVSILSRVPLDQFNTQNWTDEENIVNSVEADGSQTAVVLVTDVNENYFPDLPVGSYLPYSTQTVLAFLETNPAYNLTDINGNPVQSDVGDTNGIDGPDFLEQADPNNSFSPVGTALSCRVTGGGNDTSGIPSNGTAGWDYTTASGSFAVTETIVKTKGKSGNVTVTEETSYNVYTFGGQAGANTGQQPQPKGELEHVNHEGPAGQWSFHLGTASAPPGTEVDIIQCSDPGWCRQARPAPAKQIDIAGIGTFRNIIDDGNLNDNADANNPCASVTKLNGKPGERSIGTYNWAEFHIEDHGERGREGQFTTADPATCPATGTGTDAFSAYKGTGSRVDAVLNGTYNEFTCKTDNDPTTECPDFYRIRIYCGIEPEFDADGNLSNFDAIADMKRTNPVPIYQVYGYIDGGNWQIHPLTGFDLKGGI